MPNFNENYIRYFFLGSPKKQPKQTQSEKYYKINLLNVQLYTGASEGVQSVGAKMILGYMTEKAWDSSIVMTHLR